MIGSIQPRFIVYSDNEAHEYGAVPLFEYLKAAGVNPEYSYVIPKNPFVGFVFLVPKANVFC